MAWYGVIGELGQGAAYDQTCIDTSAFVYIGACSIVTKSIARNYSSQPDRPIAFALHTNNFREMFSSKCL